MTEQFSAYSVFFLCEIANFSINFLEVVVVGETRSRN